MQNAMFERIRREIKAHDIIIYLNGSAAFPQCEGSAAGVQTLSQLGARFKDVNIMDDGELRQALKDFADWPLFPQIYIKAEFIGGADILRELFENGELQNLLHEKGIAFSNAA